ncbi:isoform A [Biomphalaria glabrata]|nr:hypothetical protein; isoform A [Biomphalaria glabrata]KAI8791095.1 hypothetical protein BgiBS90_009019 [Biomphalaria glabrata]
MSFKYEPKRPEYSTYEQRIATYTTWNVAFISPIDLAMAGLWYLGEGDRVRCFFCGGGLRDWLPDDIPLKEHQKLFPKCGYLELVSNNPMLESSKSRL